MRTPNAAADPDSSPAPGLVVVLPPPGVHPLRVTLLSGLPAASGRVDVPSAAGPPQARPNAALMNAAECGSRGVPRVTLTSDESLRLPPIETLRTSAAPGGGFMGTLRSLEREWLPGGDRHQRLPHATRARHGQVGHDVDQRPATPSITDSAGEEPSPSSCTRAYARPEALSSEMPTAVFDSLVEMWAGILCADLARHPEYPALHARDCRNTAEQQDTDGASTPLVSAPQN
jgi:hypothetical protein